MHRLHLDDLKYSMVHDHYAYLARWLERYGYLVVAPDPVRVPDKNMPGCSLKALGKFGETEPFPPYNAERQFMEDARSGKIKPPEPR